MSAEGEAIRSNDYRKDTTVKAPSTRPAAVLGLDVGKSSHWACLIDRGGEVLASAPVRNREGALDALFSSAPAGTLVVVDQFRNIGSLAVRRARAAGLAVAYLPGLAASRAAGPRKDARLVKSAFATLSFPISDIEVFHTDRGSEFDNAEIDLMLEAFGIERSLSAKGCPYDNAVDESTNRILKAELVHRETFGTTRELRAKLSDYVHWYNNFRIHSTLGYMSPVEFREAGLSLPESSK